MFGFNIVKIFETEEQDIDEPTKQNDGLYPDYQDRQAKKQYSYTIMNTIMRHVFLILTSKLSTLKRDETR